MEHEVELSIVDLFSFYNHIILGEYLVLDLRPSLQYDAGAIFSAVNAPPSHSTDPSPDLLAMINYNDRRDKVFAFFAGHMSALSGLEKQHLNQLAAHCATMKAKTLCVLEGGFAQFQRSFPFLACLGQDERLCYPPLILDGLYLGSALMAGSRAVLHNLGITHVLNVTIEEKNFFENESTTNANSNTNDGESSSVRPITYCRIAVFDGEGEADALERHFERAFDFIHNAIAQPQSGNKYVLFLFF
jgi:hypothetical protein